VEAKKAMRDLDPAPNDIKEYLMPGARFP